jgi:hypothetical protein
MVAEQVKVKPRAPTVYAAPASYSFNLEQLWEDRERVRRGGFQRIEL